MRHPFNEEKTTQAAAKFLVLAGGQINYMLLIKLLYLLDRTALIRWGRPVSFDEFYSMSWGPVLSNVHDLITEMPVPQHESAWVRAISEPSRYQVALRENVTIGDEKLSEAEEELIREIFEDYGEPYLKNPFKLVERLHEELPEWKQVEQGQRERIDVEEILEAGQRSEDEIRAIQDELDNIGTIKAFAC